MACLSVGVWCVCGVYVCKSRGVWYVCVVCICVSQEVCGMCVCVSTGRVMLRGAEREDSFSFPFPLTAA